MAKLFSKRFYNSKEWIDTRTCYAASKFNLCERCNNSGNLVHHRILLTPENISDVSITLDWKNLELLCIDCHNAEHTINDTDDGYYFDEDGYLKPPGGGQ